MELALKKRMAPSNLQMRLDLIEWSRAIEGYMQGDQESQKLNAGTLAANIRITRRQIIHRETATGIDALINELEKVSQHGGSLEPSLRMLQVMATKPVPQTK